LRNKKEDILGIFQWLTSTVWSPTFFKIYFVCSDRFGTAFRHMWV